ncbi:hypothetical protein E2320_002332 [Naja naja]|nr:hypothetical protein E2320_002332 [Naja naja]
MPERYSCSNSPLGSWEGDIKQLLPHWALGGEWGGATAAAECREGRALALLHMAAVRGGIAIPTAAVIPAQEGIRLCVCACVQEMRERKGKRKREK